MNKKKLGNSIAQLLAWISLQPILVNPVVALSLDGGGCPIEDRIDSARCSCQDGEIVDEPYLFSGEHYAYGRFGSRQESGQHGFDGAAYLRRHYDTVNPFSSGVSSYQGTSTGPGPNGGYPGAPRGVYKTNYRNPTR